MIELNLKVVLLATCLLIQPALADQGPVCVPVCKNGACPVTLHRLDLEECWCRIQLMEKHHKVRRLKIHNNTLTFPTKFKPGGEAMLYVQKTKTGPICYHLGKGNASNTNKRRRVKLKCSKSDELDISSAMVLSKQGWHATARNNSDISVNKLVKDPKAASNKCHCWSPQQVKISLQGNSTMIVQWSPFYAHEDLRISLEKMPSMEAKHEYIGIHQVCKERLLNYTFSDFEAGTYTAMVGSVGCECKTQSDPITISRLTLEEPTVFQTQPSTPKLSRGVNHTTVVIVVGVLAFIGVFSLGLALIVRECRRIYQPVGQNEEAPIEAEYQPVGQNVDAPFDAGSPISFSQFEELSFHCTETEVIEKIGNHFRTLVNGNDVMVTTPICTPFDPNMDKLEIFVTLKDAHSFIPKEGVQSRTRIEILMNHVFDMDDFEIPLVASVPNDCPDPRLTRRNNVGGLATVWSIGELFQAIVPTIDFKSQEYQTFVNCARDTSKQMKDEIQNIFIISGNVHDYHNDACRELTKMLKMLNKKVLYGLDDSNRKQQQLIGPHKWILDNLKETDLVLVVATEYLSKVTSGYLHGKSSQELSRYQATSAPFALKALSERLHGPKIAYLTFGYDSEHVDEIVALSKVNFHMRYDLVETMMTEGQGETSALKIFFSRLTSDRLLIQQACDQSEEFYKNVRHMKTMMTNERYWLTARFSSTESFVESWSMTSSEGYSEVQAEDETSF